MGLKEAIPSASATGAAGVAFDLRNELTETAFGETALKQLLHRLSEHGLKVATAYFPLRLPLHEAAHADERITAIEGAMQRARRLRATELAIPTGPLPAGGSPDDERLIETATAIATAGNRTGTIPCFDCGGAPAERVLELLTRIDTGPVAVDVNPIDWLPNSSRDSAASKLRLGELSFGGSTNDGGEPTLEGFLRSTSERIGHVQGRDGRRTGRGSTTEAPIGTGLVDWPLLMALLDEAGYTGWVTVRSELASEPLADISQGVAFLRRSP
jgi:sugar phosphate isomerase/epimerase